jgi:hypothetical protein
LTEKTGKTNCGVNKRVILVLPPEKELTRLPELSVDYFMFDNQYGSSDKLRLGYFYPFNFAARKKS